MTTRKGDLRLTRRRAAQGGAGTGKTVLGLEDVRRFKGLERSAVVLVELEEHLDDAARLDVALSRARNLLVVLGTQEARRRLGFAGVAE